MRKLIVLGFVGLIAQLIDGSLGMAYGVTSSTLLLAAGIAPAAASAAVHFSEIGTSLVSGFSHHQLGNVDWRTVSILAVPASSAPSSAPRPCPTSTRPTRQAVVAGILLGLGIYVIYRFLASAAAARSSSRARGRVPGPDGPRRRHARRRRWRWLGPGRHHVAALLGRLEPRKVVGSIDTSEFVVAVGGSLGFLLALGSQGINWGLRRALLAGGVVAAPIAAWLVKHLAGPGPRRRRRWPDRAHQHQDDRSRRSGRRSAQVGVIAAVLVVAWIAGIVWAVSRSDWLASSLPSRPGARDGLIAVPW